MKIASEVAEELPKGFCDSAENVAVGLLSSPRQTLTVVLSAGLKFAGNGAMRVPAAALLPKLRQLAAAGDAMQRARGLSMIGRNEELDLVDARLG